MNKPTFEVSRLFGGWIWQLQMPNGICIADSTRAYSRKRDCLRAIDRVLMAIFDADVKVIE